MLGLGADVYVARLDGLAPLHGACMKGSVDAARLLLERGVDINRPWSPGGDGKTPHGLALDFRHAAMAAWLARIRAAGGWSRHCTETRYALVVLRELVVKGRARRERALLRAFHGNERVLAFLFPGSDPLPSRLPNSLFPLVARYYWDGGPSAEETAIANGYIKALVEFRSKVRVRFP